MGIGFSGNLDGRKLTDDGEWEDDFKLDANCNGIHTVVKIGKNGALKETGDEINLKEVFNQIEIYGERFKEEDEEPENQGAEY